ncbi:unnamed protein product [Pleuronectes platessa]|uniref:Uncharacterized protein n=1 Tax=Pleuronectes platessa TaxID=8262 RepID=A0A9N7TZJ8_PLEPL|nr:unnamed protein product [Pleuronectes platessa]
MDRSVLRSDGSVHMQLIVVAEEVPPHTVEPALIPGPAAGGCAAFPNMSPSSHRSYRGGHGVVAFLHVLLSITVFSACSVDATQKFGEGVSSTEHKSREKTGDQRVLPPAGLVEV